MIIQCENCDKKFEVKDELIPSSGRLLQCSSCNHQWHFIPDNKLELTEEVEIKVKQNKVKKKVEIINEEENNISQNINNKNKSNKSIGVVSWLFILIISLTALIILIDTFEYQISLIFPNISLYMESLSELLTDIYLFLIDLIK
tara:strand:+ start:614 stop:1045 length:432 start_codon:yes stop_codon:yes gene_type:complete